MLCREDNLILIFSFLFSFTATFLSTYSFSGSMGENGLPGNSRHLDVLVELAKHGIGEEVRLPTTRLASTMGISQQSASRLMKGMESLSLISRKVFADGQVVRIEKPGIDILNKRYAELSSIFSKKKISIAGELVSGVGEGRYYVGLKGYKKQFREKLNFIPYAGTLNLRVDEKTGRAVSNITESIAIEGFRTKKRSFGGLKCVKAKLEHKDQQIIAAVIKPFRTVHGEDIVEVIAPYYLRERLEIKDGDRIKLVV